MSVCALLLLYVTRGDYCEVIYVTRSLGQDLGAPARTISPLDGDLGKFILTTGEAEPEAVKSNKSFQ